MNSLTLRAAGPELETLLNMKVTGVRVVDAWEYHLDLERDRTLVLGLSPEHNTVYWAEGVDKKALRARTPRLASAMRDHLVGSRLTGVNQAGLDRVACFSFSGRDRLGDPTHHQVVAELTGKGANLLLLAGDVPLGGKLVERLRSDRSQSGKRELTYGAEYVLPPSAKIDASRAGVDELAAALEAAPGREEDARKAMAAVWEGVSPETAGEVARLAGEEASPREWAEAWLRLLKETLPGGERFEPLVLTGSQGRPRVMVYRPAEADKLNPESCATVMEALARAHAAFKEGRRKKPNHLLLQNVHRAIRRSENALKAIAKQTGSVEADPERLRRMGELVLAHAHEIEKGAKSASLTDPGSGDELAIKLNPKLSAADNAALYFKKAKKADRAGSVVDERSRELDTRLKDLRRLQTDLAGLGDKPPSTDLLERMHALGVSLPQKEASQLKDERAGMASDLRPRSYDLGRGWEVLVGKNNRGNHVLTFEIAKPHELWMHAAQCPGSHVVLRHQEKGKEPPRDVLLTAAGIAAYFSKARNSTKVPVTVTEKRYVRRPRKAPVGQALVGEHRTLMVTPINPEGKS